MAETGNNVDRAAEIILEGGLVAIPTETVYGLAANTLNEKAILSIFEAKQRPFFDPLIVHVHSLEAVGKYADLDDHRLLKLAKTFWPGPLTLLLPKKNNIPSIVTSGLERVAIRVPNHELTLKLLEKLDLPLAAPSANPFGYVSPTLAQHVEKQLGHKVNYILDGGPSKVGLESTIVGIEEGNVCVYRLGGLSLEEIEKVVGKVELRINNSSDPKAPGQLKNHYAPRKPLFVGDLRELSELHKNEKIAIIHFGNKEIPSHIKAFDLSPGKDLKEAALNLFRFLREADESSAEIVLCEPLPDEGLGRAINDRLRRASVQ
ncbi:MAG: threonylcarbamoyl-AMP synthase [Bacteroidia bacterium]|nr:threonylcarbamoyl-AMP synthase [Bacteroidia bacterium]